MYETAAFDGPKYAGFEPDPVLIIAATGTHDVSRMIHLLSKQGNSEQGQLAQRVTDQVRRNKSGRSALQLLRDHGGQDFTATPTDESPTTDPKALLAAIADPGSVVGPRFGPSWKPGDVAYREVAETVPQWQTRAVLATLAGATADSPSLLARLGAE